MHLPHVTVQCSTEAPAGIPKYILTAAAKIATISNRGIEREMCFSELRLKMGEGSGENIKITFGVSKLQNSCLASH